MILGAVQRPDVRAAWMRPIRSSGSLLTRVLLLKTRFSVDIADDTLAHLLGSIATPKPQVIEWTGPRAFFRGQSCCAGQTRGEALFKIRRRCKVLFPNPVNCAEKGTADVAALLPPGKG